MYNCFIINIISFDNYTYLNTSWEVKLISLWWFTCRVFPFGTSIKYLSIHNFYNYFEANNDKNSSIYLHFKLVCVICFIALISDFRIKNYHFFNKFEWGKRKLIRWESNSVKEFNLKILILKQFIKVVKKELLTL